MGPIAWGDESIRHKGLAHPHYLLCACVCEDEDEMRKALRELKPKGARKLHWRNMSDSMKQRSIQIIGALGPWIYVIAAREILSIKDERARRKCLDRLLPMLDQEHIGTYVLESRQPSRDKLDVAHLIHLKARGYVDALSMSHLPGEADPCLWLPDQVLGAYGDNLTGELDFGEFVSECVLDETITV